MFYFVVCLFAALSFTLQATAADFIVGTTSGYAPYVSLNEKGEYEGFDIDVAKNLAEKLGRKLIIKDLGSMPALILALKQKKIDAIIWAISITQERQKHMAMIYYQGDGEKEQPLLFWGKIPGNNKAIEDMANNKNAVISVEAGSFQENFLLEVPGLSLKQVDKVSDAILELKFGKSQAAMIDNSLVAIYQAKFPELKSLSIPLPESKQSSGVGICLNFDSTSLIPAIEKAVSEMLREGTIAQLEMKWKLKGS
jgi:ABC-type amino acid transport substrate-binding protein